MLLLLLLLSHFSRVRLCATPEMAAHQAPLSLGFSRQEYWSGLPFLSTMHESEKWVKSLSHVWLFATPWTAAYHAPLSMGFSRQEYWSRLPLTSPIKDTWSYKLSVSVSCPVVPDSLRPHGLQPTRLLCPSDFPGKDTGMGCHFLLQRILPIQGLIPGLLHCWQILHRLSYKGGEALIQ